MRLSGWRSSAPFKDSLGPKVLAVIEPVMQGLGTDEDPHVWVFWGDDPAIRFLVFALTPAGLVTCNVRVFVPGEGPRASGKLTRWSRVQLGEVSVDGGAGGSLVTSGQLENQVIRVGGDKAELAARFLQGVVAAIDGRPIPDLDVPRRRARRTSKPTSKANARQPSVRASAAKQPIVKAPAVKQPTVKAPATRPAPTSQRPSPRAPRPG